MVRHNRSINTLFKPISNESLLLGISASIIAMVPIILMINNYAYENGKLVCDNYVLNSYLYTLLGFCLVAMGAIFEQKVHIINKLLGNDSLLMNIIGLIIIIGIFMLLVYIIKKTDPNNFVTIHAAYFAAAIIFGMMLSLILLLGYATGVLYNAIIITIVLTAIMAYIGYKYGHLFITVNFDKWLQYSLIALIVWAFIAPFIIHDIFTLFLAISIPSAIIFCLLLMSYNNKLRENQKTCKVPNYPDEALGLIVKIGNLLADVIRILISLKAKRRGK